MTEELPRQEAYSQLDPTNQTIMLITTEAGANNKYLRKKVLFLVFFFYNSILKIILLTFLSFHIED